MSFKRGRDPKKVMRIGIPNIKELEDHPVCRGMNDIWDDVWKNRSDPNHLVYLNPDDQYSFNYGNFSIRDFEAWMDGEGPIVRGKTPGQKKKYWDYACFTADRNIPEEYQHHPRFYIKLTWKFWDQFVTDHDPHKHRGSGHYMQVVKPIKVKRKTSDQLQQQINENRVIIDMFAPFIQQIVSDMEYRDWHAITHEYGHIFHGVKYALYNQGVGYFGASNTPEEIRNLSWVTDIVYAKALYQFYEKRGVPMPDFEWLTSRNHYDD